MAFDSIIPLLCRETGLMAHDLVKIIDDAPDRYKNYRIPKRSGGYRSISQPAIEVKALQRALIKNVLHNLPIHKCATAYREGISILDNARAHAGSGCIAKFDFKDFFPSIKANDWIKYCKKNKIFLHEDDISMTARILFRRNKPSEDLLLSIGAPSSPILSNVLLRDLDTEIESKFSSALKYTRYADDITFSASTVQDFKGLEKRLRSVLRLKTSPKLILNDQKTVFVTPAHQRRVTGLILSNDGRVTIGRKRKREISAKIHYLSVGKFSVDQMEHLSGYVSFIQMIEPDFYLRLSSRYGESIMKRISQFNTKGD